MNTQREVKLPPQQIFETPMPLRTDAYTVGSPAFNALDALNKSVYYITNRKSLNPEIDDRMIVDGTGRIVESLFRKPLTHPEIDDCVASLANFQVTADGFIPYPFPEKIWRRVVDEFNGRPPIRIDAVRDGSVVYPNEPFCQVTSTVEGFGDLAAWVESKLLQVYGFIERITRNEHFLIEMADRVQTVDSSLDRDTAEFIASNMLIDFSDRAGLNQTESDDLGMVQLYTFGGTDNLSGHFQAFKQSGNQGRGCSILALAHRNVQSFATEKDCYEALNNTLVNGGSGSFVADLNDYKTAISKYLIPIVQSNLLAGNRKTVVFRPDSGDVKEQVAWTLTQCTKEDMFYTVLVDEIEMKIPTGWKMILADGLTMPDMTLIALLVNELGYVFYETILFGSGGGLRNGLKRDNGSTKFALNAKGNDLDGVCKFSEDSGKGTLPGPLKLMRNQHLMDNGLTIAHIDEYPNIPSELINFFDGSNIWEPFGEGCYDMFDARKARIRDQMKTMPKFMPSPCYGGFPISMKLDGMRSALKHTNAPNK